MSQRVLLPNCYETGRDQDSDGKSSIAEQIKVGATPTGRLCSVQKVSSTRRFPHAHPQLVDEVSVGQRVGIQHADISRITLNAIPDIDICLGFAYGAVVRVFALVDGTIGVVLLLLGAELLLIPSAADVIPLLELLELVILELLEQVFFSPPQSLLRFKIALACYQ